MHRLQITPSKLAIVIVLIFGDLFIGAGHVMAGGISLRPPYDGQYQLTSFFDHYYPNYSTTNGVVIYDGENVDSCSPHCYQGHPGYDWSMTEGTPIHATSSGIVETTRFNLTTGYGNYIVINHPDGFRTLYAHLRANTPFNVSVGDVVGQGDIVGWSGNTGNSTGAHLHFGVYRGPFSSDEINVTDPFGWRGDYPDPLLGFGSGHTASCLWRSSDDDPISCADTIIEDAGAFGFTITGTWSTSEIGNGYHMFVRSTTTGNDNATWCFPTYYYGRYKFYAWIPRENATSQSANYGIWTSSGWQTVTINQNLYSNVWVPLGDFYLDLSSNPSYNCVILNANTGEPTVTPASKLVGVDAIKIRIYPLYLPLIAYP
jgi:hypothetical protein